VAAPHYGSSAHHECPLNQDDLKEVSALQLPAQETHIPQVLFLLVLFFIAVDITPATRWA
jgi:hypothetical protein